MKKIALVLASAALFAGCQIVPSPVNGIWFTDVKYPGYYDGASERGPGSKSGSAECQTILGLIATGDASIAAAASNAERPTGPVRAAMVSPNFFSTLGVNPARGRVLAADQDGARDGRAVVVISDEYWRRAFGGSPDVLTRTLTINDTRYDIVGVTPPGFTGEWIGRPADLWLPMGYPILATNLAFGVIVGERSVRHRAIFRRLYRTAGRYLPPARLVTLARTHFADPGEGQVGPPRAHRRHQARAEHVARRFAGDEVDQGCHANRARAGGAKGARGQSRWLRTAPCSRT